MTGLILQDSNEVGFSASSEVEAPTAPAPRSTAGWTEQDEGEATPGTRRRDVLAIGIVSLLVHSGFAGYLTTVHYAAPPAYRPPSRVEVQLTRPPPPPPPPTPAKEPPPPPPPPPKVVAPKPKAITEPPKPATAPPPIVQQETREDIGIDAPEGEDGVLPKGTGEIGTAPPAPPPGPPTPPAPPPPAPVIGAREGANYQKNPRPPYPALAVRKGWEGQTILRVQVLPNGRPGAVNVQTSSGRDVLDEAAIEAVKGWTFVPATQGGLAISGWVNVPIVFRLQ